MIAIRRVLALFVSLSASLAAQQPDYRPAYKLTNGKEILVVYIGASTCGPCMFPAVKDAVKSMKALVATQAKQQGAAFQVIGVSNDWEVDKGTEFLAPLGAFDQVVIGGNWTNLAVERFIWRDSTGTGSIPQVLVLERTINFSGPTMTISDTKLLRRMHGSDAIPAWVAAGAPISDKPTP